MGQSRGRSNEHGPVRRWQRALVSRWIMAAAVAVAAIGGLTVARRQVPGESPVGLVTWIFITLFLIVALGVANLLAQLAGIDADAERIAGELADEPAQQRLLARWLNRARWARFVGGLAGVLVWVLGTQAHGDVLLLGTVGIGLGALAAEAHHVRPRRGPRTVSLEVRSLSQYLPPAERKWMVAVGGMAVATAVLGACHAPSRAALAWGLGAVGSLGLARWAQTRVVGRPRPAVPDVLVRADDLARHLAVTRGLARPAVYVALALTSRAFDALEPLIGGVARALAVVAWLTALVLWVRNRRLGLDKVRRQPAGAVVGA